MFGPANAEMNSSHFSDCQNCASLLKKFELFDLLKQKCSRADEIALSLVELGQAFEKARKLLLVKQAKLNDAKGRIKDLESIDTQYKKVLVQIVSCNAEAQNYRKILEEEQHNHDVTKQEKQLVEEKLQAVLDENVSLKLINQQLDEKCVSDQQNSNDNVLKNKKVLKATKKKLQQLNLQHDALQKKHDKLISSLLNVASEETISEVSLKKLRRILAGLKSKDEAAKLEAELNSPTLTPDGTTSSDTGVFSDDEDPCSPLSVASLRDDLNLSSDEELEEVPNSFVPMTNYVPCERLTHSNLSQSPPIPSHSSKTLNREGNDSPGSNLVSSFGSCNVETSSVSIIDLQTNHLNDSICTEATSVKDIEKSPSFKKSKDMPAIANDAELTVDVHDHNYSTGYKQQSLPLQVTSSSSLPSQNSFEPVSMNLNSVNGDCLAASELPFTKSSCEDSQLNCTDISGVCNKSASEVEMVKSLNYEGLKNHLNTENDVEMTDKTQNDTECENQLLEDASSSCIPLPQNCQPCVTMDLKCTGPCLGSVSSVCNSNFETSSVSIFDPQADHPNNSIRSESVSLECMEKSPSYKKFEDMSIIADDAELTADVNDHDYSTGCKQQSLSLKVTSSSSLSSQSSFEPVSVNLNSVNGNCLVSSELSVIESTCGDSGVISTVCNESASEEIMVKPSNCEGLNNYLNSDSDFEITEESQNNQGNAECEEQFGGEDGSSQPLPQNCQPSVLMDLNGVEADFPDSVSSNSFEDSSLSALGAQMILTNDTSVCNESVPDRESNNSSSFEKRIALSDENNQLMDLSDNTSTQEKQSSRLASPVPSPDNDLECSLPSPSKSDFSHSRSVSSGSIHIQDSVQNSLPEIIIPALSSLIVSESSNVSNKVDNVLSKPSEVNGQVPAFEESSFGSFHTNVIRKNHPTDKSSKAELDVESMLLEWKAPTLLSPFMDYDEDDATSLCKETTSSSHISGFQSSAYLTSVSTKWSKKNMKTSSKGILKKSSRESATSPLKLSTRSFGVNTEEINSKKRSKEAATSPLKLSTRSFGVNTESVFSNPLRRGMCIASQDDLNINCLSSENVFEPNAASTVNCASFSEIEQTAVVGVSAEKKLSMSAHHSADSGMLQSVFNTLNEKILCHLTEAIEGIFTKCHSHSDANIQANESTAFSDVDLQKRFCEDRACKFAELCNQQHHELHKAARVSGLGRKIMSQSMNHKQKKLKRLDRQNKNIIKNRLRENVKHKKGEVPSEEPQDDLSPQITEIISPMLEKSVDLTSSRKNEQGIEANSSDQSFAMKCNETQKCLVPETKNIKERNLNEITTYKTVEVPVEEPHNDSSPQIAENMSGIPVKSYEHDASSMKKRQGIEVNSSNENITCEPKEKKLKCFDQNKNDGRMKLNKINKQKNVEVPLEESDNNSPPVAEKVSPNLKNVDDHDSSSGKERQIIKAVSTDEDKSELSSVRRSSRIKQFVGRSSNSLLDVILQNSDCDSKKNTSDVVQSCNTAKSPSNCQSKATPSTNPAYCSRRKRKSASEESTGRISESSDVPSRRSQRIKKIRLSENEGSEVTPTYQRFAISPSPLSGTKTSLRHAVESHSNAASFKECSSSNSLPERPDESSALPVQPTPAVETDISIATLGGSDLECFQPDKSENKNEPLPKIAPPLAIGEDIKVAPPSDDSCHNHLESNKSASLLCCSVPSQSSSLAEKRSVRPNKKSKLNMLRSRVSRLHPLVQSISSAPPVPKRKCTQRQIPSPSILTNKPGAIQTASQPHAEEQRRKAALVLQKLRDKGSTPINAAASGRTTVLITPNNSPKQPVRIRAKVTGHLSKDKVTRKVPLVRPEDRLLSCPAKRQGNIEKSEDCLSVELATKAIENEKASSQSSDSVHSSSSKLDENTVPFFLGSNYTASVVTSKKPLEFVVLREKENHLSSSYQADELRHTETVIKETLKKFIAAPSFTPMVLQNAIDVLSNKELVYSAHVIVRDVVAYVEEDYDTPLPEARNLMSLAPILTCAQQQLVTLVMQLSYQHEHFQSLPHDILKLVEYRLFRLGKAPEGDRAIWLTRLYVAICRVLVLRSKALIFCWDALYALGMKAHAIILAVLDVWPYLLPNQVAFQKACPNYQVMHHILLSQGGKSKKSKESQVTDRLRKKLSSSGPNACLNSQVLLSELSSNLNYEHLNTIPHALVLLAKREGEKWALDQVVNAHLLPALEVWRKGDLDDVVAEKVVWAMCSILRPLEVGAASSIVNTSLKLFSTDLADGSTVSLRMQEVIAIGLTLLSRHNIEKAAFSLLSWRPEHANTTGLSSYVIDHLTGLVRNSARDLWWWLKVCKDRNHGLEE